jgi:hypothetical protein
MKQRLFSLFPVLLSLFLANAALADPAPNLPLYTRTVQLAAGEVFGTSDALSLGSCSNANTQYTLVVRNGLADGTRKLASGRAGVSGEDYAGAQIQAGTSVISVDVVFTFGNTVDIDLHAPANAPATAVIEIWRKPAALIYSNPFSYPLSVSQISTATVTANASLSSAMLITRTGGFGASDRTTIKVNGTVIATKDDFQFSGQTIRKPVTLAASNTLTVDSAAISLSSNVTIKIVQINGDTAPPVLTMTVPQVVGASGYTFSGTVKDTPNGMWSFKLNGANVSYSSSSGAFSSPATLGAGANAYTFLAYDCAGFGLQNSYTIYWDRDPPVATVTSPQANAWVKTQTLAVSGTITDDAPGTRTVTVNGVNATVTNGTWTANVPLSAGDGAKTLTVVAKDSYQHSATTTAPVNLDTTAPVIAGTIVPAPESSGWNTAGAQVVFTCTDGGSGVATCSAPSQFDTSGIQSVTGTATDKAGNQATQSVTVKVDGQQPSLAIATHPAVAKQNPYTISGTVSDAHSGLLDLRCGTTAATVSGSAFTCSVPLAAGSNIVTLTAVDRVGNQRSESTDVRLDQRAPVLTLSEPGNGAVVNSAQVTIKGTASDDDVLAAVRVIGAAATIADGAFSKSVSLATGDNTISVEAEDAAGNVTTQVVSVNRFIVPAVTITSPADLAIVRTTTATISGTVSDPAATVTVNGVNAAVSGSTFTAAGVALAQGRTVITANAVSPSGATATTSTNLYRDSIPPRLEVYTPEDGATVYTSPVSISGMVDDIVVGTINAEQMRVTVNGGNAEVANRAFLMRDVPLNAGANTLTITAVDAGGNTTVVTHHVTFVPAPPQPRLEIVSGNGQSGAIGTALAQPLVVRAISPGDTPLAGAMLTFEMVNNDGTLSDGTNSGRSVTVASDANGRAQVQWTLGNRAGAGNQRVQVRGTGFAAPLEASAAARTGDPQLIVIDSGNNQFGVASDALPRPLVAIVVDQGNNRLGGVPVTFTVAQGDGSFGGQPSAVVTTDSDGRAIIRPTLGAAAGEDNNVFTASVQGVVNTAKFTASGRSAGPPASTRITGVVLDNTATPIYGVSVRVDGTTIHAQTDAQGQFVLSGAPVGYVKLFIDGSTAARPGTWPTLEYALYTLPGTDNNVGGPIYLVQLDTARGVFVDDTTGGTLKLAELPGFALEVKAGAATFPGGGRTGTVSATLVHADRIPMAPGFGQQPNFIVTIQPPGVHFDPPARLTLPNTDGLAPGASTEMYSFDHDLGQFVTIGSATVSDDGSVITSDPGVGIIKGGWHAGGDPVPPGGGSDCSECSKASDDVCVIEVAMADNQCQPDALPCTIDLCRGGQPSHVNPTITVTLESPRDNFNIPALPYAPQIIAHATLNGVPASETARARFRWTGTVKYHARYGRDVNWDIPAQVDGPNHTMTFGATRGGELTIRATLIRDGASCRYGEAKHLIQGLNPPFSDVANLFQNNNILVRIACHESGYFEPGHQNLQFVGSPGNPNVSYDGGVGIMQVTDDPQDADFWDWIMNTNHGWQIYTGKIAGADDYEDRMVDRGAPPLTDLQRQQNRVTYYNGHYYWYWRNGAWVKAPPLQPLRSCANVTQETAQCKPYYDRLMNLNMADCQ